MGTTPELGTAAAAEPATSRMTLVWAGLHHPVREYASPPPTMYFDDDELQNVEDIYGEGLDDVYNNIN